MEDGYNTKGGTYSFVDLDWTAGDQYRVYAVNVVGDTWDYAWPDFNELQPDVPAFPVAQPRSADSEVITP